MKKLTLFVGLTALIISTSSNAEGLDIDPGNWEMTSTMTMNMAGMSIPPQSFTMSECFEEDQIDPEHFNMDEDNPCDITDVSINDDTAKWSIVCPTDMGSMEGQWVFVSKGDTLSGNGSMSANYNGQEMAFTMTWEGKRTGACEK